MNAKYTNALPLYRIAQDFEQSDMILGRATMANWVIRCSERYLSLVYDRMREHLCKQRVIQADETTCQVTKDGRESINKSYMFVYRTSELSKDRPVVLYQYGRTRSKNNIRKFLEGFTGTLVSDAFSGYKSLDKNDENIQSAFCWAHYPRKNVIREECRNALVFWHFFFFFSDNYSTLDMEIIFRRVPIWKFQTL